MNLDPTADMGLHAMAEAHDAKAWDKCIDVAEAWVRARGSLPPLPCVWYAQSLMGAGRYAEAVQVAALAVHTLPVSDVLGDQIALCAARATYAQALSRIGQLSRARRVLREMIRSRVEHPETLEKQGHTTLAITDKWRDGWAMHEARSHNATMPDGLVRWDGKAKGRVGVLHEQGIGDAVLFARWLARVAEVSGEPVVWFGPEQVLGRWIGDLPNVIVGERGANVTPVDYAVWSMSLPHVAGCDRKSQLPAPVAPVSLLEQRETALTLRPYRDGPVRVGVCWKGASTGWHDFERSFTLDQFAPVWADLDGVEFVNLAHDAAILHGSPFGPAHFTDVYETGEVIAGLDLVVSVDTAVVHIAGSLGVPTLAIVPTVPDWRYSWPAGATSPFYKSVTVARRAHAADLSVIDTARAMVERFASAVNGGAA